MSAARVPVKRTDRLIPGDRVLLPFGIVRTVSDIVPSGWLNSHDVPLLNVMYSDGIVGRPFAVGNSGAPDSLWEIVVTS